MDFLSLLTMKGEESVSSVVLNSVGNIHKATTCLREQEINHVRCFFDNDQAGKEAVQRLRASGIQVEDMSRYYASHKDLNDYLIADCKRKEASKVPQEPSAQQPTIKSIIHKRHIR